jgi:ABC-type lipoprotein release transport system permease subunit
VVQNAQNYLFSGVFAMAVSLAAGYSPARRAARLQPLTIIRGAG